MCAFCHFLWCCPSITSYIMCDAFPIHFLHANLPCIFHILLLWPGHHGQMVRFPSYDVPENISFTWHVSIMWYSRMCFVHMKSLEFFPGFVGIICLEFVPGFVHIVSLEFVPGTPQTCTWLSIGWQWLTAASTPSYTIGWTKGGFIISSCSVAKLNIFAKNTLSTENVSDQHFADTFPTTYQ